jgi:hypothetical protein
MSALDYFSEISVVLVLAMKYYFYLIRQWNTVSFVGLDFVGDDRKMCFKGHLNSSISKFSSKILLVFALVWTLIC